MPAQRFVRLFRVALGWRATTAGGGLLASHFAAQRESGTELTTFQPDLLIGQRFPLLDQINIGDELSTGQWIVLLYHHDCPKCTEAAAKLAAGANETTARANGTHLAFIELPPYGPLGSITLSSAIRFGQFSEDQAWDIPTPLALRIADGKVIEVLPV